MRREQLLYITTCIFVKNYFNGLVWNIVIDQNTKLELDKVRLMYFYFNPKPKFDN